MVQNGVKSQLISKEQEWGQLQTDKQITQSLSVCGLAHVPNSIASDWRPLPTGKTSIPGQPLTDSRHRPAGRRESGDRARL
jgi:hypothetical protein